MTTADGFTALIDLAAAIHASPSQQIKPYVGRGHIGCAGNGVFARRHWCFCGRGIGVFDFRVSYLKKVTNFFLGCLLSMPKMVL